MQATIYSLHAYARTQGLAFNYIMVMEEQVEI